MTTARAAKSGLGLRTFLGYCIAASAAWVMTSGFLAATDGTGLAMGLVGGLVSLLWFGWIAVLMGLPVLAACAVAAPSGRRSTAVVVCVLIWSAVGVTVSAVSYLLGNVHPSSVLRDGVALFGGLAVIGTAVGVLLTPQTTE